VIRSGSAGPALAFSGPQAWYGIKSSNARPAPAPTSVELPPLPRRVSPNTLRKHAPGWSDGLLPRRRNRAPVQAVIKY
jgi:hypothetical protein